MRNKRKKKDCKYIIQLIWLEYFIRYNIIFDLDKNDVAYCFLKEKEIHFSKECFENPVERDIFDLLHEIGHLETNKKGMKRCEEEYYATTWAIEQMKKYDLDLSEKDKEIFQNYIWKWRNIGIKHKAKCMPAKQQLVLKW